MPGRKPLRATGSIRRSSTMVNELRFGYAHYYQTFFGTDISQNPANYNFNGQTYEFPTGITNPLYFGSSEDIRFRAILAALRDHCIGVGWPKIIGPDGVLEILDHVSITQRQACLQIWR